ncbi:UDP-N-acetylmuramoyl-L-alanyl-D-glutamate--2,6-diaminopimelate ligase [Blattabacterium cuenoti]|uniref:UDP-N-acetylmuramoyl-L-alanyl-D-glutamate--2, 6-diaminopimelate ligase n=1 Tax=Blattabacterium cuenoti TaxID=1653831 RepID=UPI00163BD295|nr:UDP-N-acetylmuramoyl-L-alanyl-D-glutamate--2,6-diaminopimelate ligase [Blattabacterium cuenoti]
MVKKLEDILKNVNILKIIGKDISRRNVEGISIWSNVIINNMIFVAKKGKITDGHKFITKAIKNGAISIVCEKIPSYLHKNVVYILVKDSLNALGIISSNFYDNPTKNIKLVGITGTNGKTSIATILHQLFSKMGEKNILISTMGIKILSNIYPTEHTTPNIIEINKYLNLSIRKGCKYAFMEVSSHGIHQKRISGLLFQGGIFTNITHDHLDYHKSFNHYLNTKKLFFDNLSNTNNNSFVLINSDDKNSCKIVKNILSKIYFYGFRKTANFRCKILKKNIFGSLILIDGNKIFTNLIGTFNVYNLLASYATAILLGKKKNDILKNIKNIKPIKGRFEQFVSDSGIRVIVDYAHNPNGLKTVLNTIQEIKDNNVKLICVIGCGGNRDVKKRSLMGKIVYDMCDVPIFTSDNPRDEEIEKILVDMKNFKSYSNVRKKSILTISNRKEAIKMAIEIAKKKDIILLFGKGHETYQEIKGVRFPFNDMEIVRELLKTKSPKVCEK